MDKDIVQSVGSLMRQLGGQGNSNGLPTPQPRGDFPSKTSSAVPTRSPSGGGIDSPLTEESREYHPGGLKSTDGLLTLPALKKLQLKDASGRDVVINFKAQI